MTTETFAQGMAFLDQRFKQGKATAKPTANIYYERLRRIPDEAWIDICETAVEDLKTFPTPGELRSLWYDWQRNHPEKMVKAEKTYCPECYGTGYLWAKKEVPDLARMWGRYDQATLFLCAKCDNANGIPRSARRATREQLKAEGYGIEELAGNDQDRQKWLGILDVKEIAKAILKDLPKPPDAAELERRRQDQKQRLAQHDRKTLASGEVDDIPF